MPLSPLPRAAALCAVLLATPIALRAQTADDPAAKLVRAMAEALRTTAHLPGLSIAVDTGDRVIFVEGFGNADIALARRVTPATQFLTASVGKVITATALAKLVEEGRVNLDAPVHYVPPFPVKQWPITPHQLAGHLAGIPHYNPSDKIEKRFYTSVEDGLSVFAAESLRFEPALDTRGAHGTDVRSA